MLSVNNDGHKARVINLHADGRFFGADAFSFAIEDLGRKTVLECVLCQKSSPDGGLNGRVVSFDTLSIFVLVVGRDLEKVFVMAAYDFFFINMGICKFAGIYPIFIFAWPCDRAFFPRA